MACTLDSKAKKIAVILNPRKNEDTFPPEFYPRLNEWLIQNAHVYAYILHDLDILDDGEPKRHHIHIYAEMAVCKRLMTNLNELADWLGYENNQISIQRATNCAGCVQYLIHKNDPLKHQYEAKEIVSNLAGGELQTLLDDVAGNCSITYFIACACRARKLTEYIQMVGLDVYQKYHATLIDIWRDVHK